MKIKVSEYHYETIQTDKLIEGRDFELIGFVIDNSIFSKCSGVLQPVYSIEGKKYTSNLYEYPLTDIVEQIESSYQAWGVNLEFIREFINNLSIYISKDGFFNQTYSLNVDNHDLTLKISDTEIIKEDIICLTEEEYIGAIELPNGIVVVGSEEFIEKTIIERIEDVKIRFDLLNTLYTNYKDYHKKDDLIRDIFNNHFEELSEEDKIRIKNMKHEHDFIMQGITMAEGIRDTYKGVVIRRI